MKKLLTVAFLMLSMNLLFGQEFLLNSFDAASADTNYWAYFDNHGGQHYQTSVSADSALGWLTLTYPTTNPVPQEGAGAMQVEYSVQNCESWGGYTKLEHWNPDTNAVYDWSLYQKLAFWYYNSVPESEASRITFRLNLHDISESETYNVYSVNQCEFYYSFLNILDNAPGWNYVEIPLVNNYSWDGNGFNLTNWSGIPGNGILDLDKIKGFSFEFSINGSGSGEAVTGTIIFDKLFLTGIAPRPVVMFNGAVVPNNVNCSTWNGSYEIEANAGFNGITPAIKWMHGAGQAWTGIVWDFNDVVNLAYHWDTDTLKFWMKAEPGTGNLRMQWEDMSNPVNKVGKNFDPIADGTYHYYEFALADMTTFYDGSTTFDYANINLFQILTEGSGAGTTVYLDNVWTGSPEFDIIPPDAPGSVTALAGENLNLITWTDVAGETGEVYDVYYSLEPITDLSAKNLECAGYAVAEGTQLVEHVLLAPVNDQNLTYYYAVVCRDASNNQSEIAQAASSVTNMAQGTPVISPVPPANFAVDGDVTEWTNAGIVPIRIFPSDGTGTIVNNTVIDGDADCSANAYLAVDNEFLYIAVDVFDDIVSSDETIASYLRDAPDLFIGLYDWRGPTHTSYKRGSEPDYQWRFNKESAIMGNLGDDVMGLPGDGRYAWFEKFGTGYVIEGKFAWTDIAAAATPSDNVFSPLVGMKIKLDFSINDADATGSREGILTYSKDNQDHSWEHVWRWTYTWIGDQMVDVDDEFDSQIPTAFNLDQNYPNPFNPATKIRYTVASDANVSLKVYNILGQQVADLVNEMKKPGYYEVSFDASQLASGIYIYKLQAGSFVSSKKMMLIK